MSQMKQTAFRLSEEDRALLDAVRAHVGLPTLSDALRMAIHKVARLEGVAPPQPRKKDAKSAA